MDPILLIAPVLTKSGPFPLSPPLHLSSLLFSLSPLLPFPLCPLGHEASTRQSACHASSARPSLRWNQRRFIEQIGSSPSVVGAEPCSVPMLAANANADREQWFSTLLFASKVADSTRLWLRSGLTVHRVLHTMQFRVHLRGVDRGKRGWDCPLSSKNLTSSPRSSVQRSRLKL